MTNFIVDESAPIIIKHLVELVKSSQNQLVEAINSDAGDETIFYPARVEDCDELARQFAVGALYQIQNSQEFRFALQNVIVRAFKKALLNK